MLTVTLDLVGYKQHAAALGELSTAMKLQAAKTVENLAHVAVEAAKGVSPEGQHPFGVPDGYTHFKDDWKAEQGEADGWPSLTLENVSPHAAFVLNDTRPHEITAVHAKALRFKGRGGETVFRQQVHHPGTKAKDLLGPLEQALEPKVKSELTTFSDAMAQAFDRAFA